MLPCARSCIGKKLNRLPAVCADSQPIEPLLFLYPRWFREDARQTRFIHRAQSRNLSTAPDVRNALSAATSKDDTFHLTFYDAGHEDGTNVAQDDTSPANHGLDYDRLTSLYPPSPSWSTQVWQTFSGNERKRRHQEHSERSILSSERQINRHRTSLEHPKEVNSIDIARTLPGRQNVAPQDSNTIALEASFLEWLTGTSEEIIWKHHDGSGCTVHVTKITEKNPAFRKVLLIGTTRAREITNLHLNHLQEAYNEQALQKPNNQVACNNSIIYNTYRRVDHIPRPEVWSFRSFNEYVRTITSSCAPKAVNRTLYPTKSESFHATVGKILVEIFSAPHLHQYQTSSALKQALMFCSVSTEMSLFANRIWTAARQAGVVPDIACFNFEIDRCIKIRDEGAIRRVVSEMGDTHIRPNGATLACFFRLLDSKEEQSLFLQLPNIQHATNDQSAREMLVAGFVRSEFEPSDRNPEVVDAFQQKMQKQFGDGWLNPLIVRNMILKCSSVAAYHTLSQVLRLAANLSVKIDTESFLILFREVQKTGCFEDVLSLLQISPSRLNPSVNQFEIEIAFRGAWRHRLVNTCRVLWHYAASHGSIRHMMMMKVAKELPYNVNLGKNVHLTALMAKIIVGADYSSASVNAESTLKNKKEITYENVAKLSQFTTDGEARHNLLQFSHFLIEREMTAWQRVEPMDYSAMLDLINQAYSLDLSWLHEGLGPKSSALDWVRRAIQIDLKPRTEPIGSPEGDNSKVELTRMITNLSLEPNINACKTQPLLAELVGFPQGKQRNSNSESLQEL